MIKDKSKQLDIFPKNSKSAIVNIRSHFDRTSTILYALDLGFTSL